MKTQYDRLTELADSFIRSDIEATLDDVKLLGINGAAIVAAKLASDQPHWKQLASAEGRLALNQAIGQLASLH